MVNIPTLRTPCAVHLDHVRRRAVVHAAASAPCHGTARYVACRAPGLGANGVPVRGPRPTVAPPPGTHVPAYPAPRTLPHVPSARARCTISAPRDHCEAPPKLSTHPTGRASCARRWPGRAMVHASSHKVRGLPATRLSVRSCLPTLHCARPPARPPAALYCQQIRTAVCAAIQFRTVFTWLAHAALPPSVWVSRLIHCPPPPPPALARADAVALTIA